jgi:leucyl aminopeptidase
MELHFAQRARFKPTAKTARGALVLLVPEQGKMPDWLADIDRDVYGKIKKVTANSRFEAKKKQILTILAPEGLQYEQLILVGLGKGKELDAISYEEVGGVIVGELNRLGANQAGILCHEVRGCKLNEQEAALHLATGIKLKSYRFDKYKTKQTQKDKASLEQVTIAVNETREVISAFEVQEKVLEGTYLTRDLVNEPGNVLEPESYAKIIEEKLTPLGVKVQVLGEKELSKLGCGALLGVGQGSVKESKMVVMEWSGGKKKDQPIAFIGKGVTFDTGGISIKPSGGMEEMKMDMGGSGAVVGLMQALASRKAKSNVIGVVGLVENMPDGNAQRPGDVVTSLSGQTVEVLNTDAEGRLVLADCLWYCQDKYKPQFMINLATLTGAIMVSLGETTGGLFSNNDKLSERILEASEATGEKMWRMPMGPEYDKLLDSDIADMQNISSSRWGGSITAAQFLQRFVNDVPWAHLDIAGVATASKPFDICPKGATGFGVRLLNEMVAKHYES